LVRLKCKDNQRCSKCGRAKPLSAYRRQSHRANGRDTICRACRNRHDQEVKEKSFGPLPEPEGSVLWLAEIQRRAAVIRSERRTVEAAQGACRGAQPPWRRYGVMAERQYRVCLTSRIGAA